MYVDGWMLFAIYFIAVLALAVSVYAVWSLEEIRQYYEKRSSKPNNAWDHYHKKARESITVPRAKGHWD